jgi:hypothetical protein
MIRPAAVVLLALSACGDDGGSTPNIDGPLAIDAAVDAKPMPDADPSLAPLVGTWNRAPEQDPDTGFDSITFTADGKTMTAEGANTETGTYSVPAMGRVSLVPDGAGQTIVTDFVVDHNKLILTAFLPVGTPNGNVGTWTNHTTSGTMMSTATVVTNSDMTASYTLTGPSGTQAFTGTWAAESIGFVLSATQPAPLAFQFRPIGTLAIGYLIFAKS